MTKEIDPLEKSPDLPPSTTEAGERKYEQSGLYPPGEKPFRLIRLIGSLLGVILFLVITALLLDSILI